MPDEPPVDVLTVTNVTKSYRDYTWFGRRARHAVSALRDVNLTLRRGETLGIVGRSGAGKSTLAHCIACLEMPDSGEICLEGQNLGALRASELRRFRRRIQLIFQHSAASINPSFSALEVVTEPLKVAGNTTKAERIEIALSLMESVGLPRSFAARRATEFSGGQRQRLAIARALSLSPSVLILDESLSGLDLTMQAQLVNLLLDLQRSRGVSYVFISHDLRLAAHVADDLAVLHEGSIAEYGPVEQVWNNPQTSITRALLEAVRPASL